MKQKALFMILLAGFLNLISCISDNESQSVTDALNNQVPLWMFGFLY